MYSKKFGIICAMPEEAQFIIIKYNLILTIGSNTWKVYENNDIVLIITNIGKVAASSATSFLINNYKIEHFINFGLVASKFSEDVGETYLIDKIYENDMLIPFESYKQYVNKYFQGLLLWDDYNEDLKEYEFSSKIKNISSGDRFITNIDDIINDNETVQLLDMESFGIAFTLYCYDRKAFYIKTVSDSISNENDNKIDFIKNMERCILNGTRVLNEFITLMNLLDN